MHTKQQKGHHMGAWIIRAGRGGVYAEDWATRGIIGIGWDLGGASIAAMPKDAIRQAYADLHPGESRGKVAAAVSQAAHFAHDMGKGITVVMYDPSSRLYHIGKVTGDCRPTPEADGIEYSRTVAWAKTAPRDALAQSSKNSLGGIQTIFAISDEVMADLDRAAADNAAPAAPADVADEDDSDEEARYATYDDGIERIKDRVLSLEWEDMERLVAGLLKAMGYCARITPKGPDGGRDVVASPDPPGLESPHIVADVKHRKGAMGAPAVRSFIGGLRADDRGLYVSTGGFTKEARYEAERANVPVRLLDIDGFVRLYVDVYDKTDEETRAILPLVRIWWPA